MMSALSGIVPWPNVGKSCIELYLVCLERWLCMENGDSQKKKKIYRRKRTRMLLKKRASCRTWWKKLIGRALQSGKKLLQKREELVKGKTERVRCFVGCVLIETIFSDRGRPTKHSFSNHQFIVYGYFFL